MKYTQIFSKWLKEVLTHSTVIGRVWLTTLFFFRVLMVIIQAKMFGLSDLNSFVCNAHQPGCTERCHDLNYPIIPAHFWSAQILAVSTPTLLYLLYVMHVIYGDRMASKHVDGRASVAVRKSVKYSYFTQLFAKIILEVLFIYAHYYLYGFAFSSYVLCESDPCPHRVDCFQPHSNELTIISVYMIVVACVSVFLNVVEASMLLLKNIKKRNKEGLDEGFEVNGLKQVNE